MNGANLVMLLVIIVLLFALIFLAIAEMGLSKMTKPRAAAITEDKPRIEPSLTALVDNPEGWINPLLLMVNVCQTVQATLTGIVAGNLFGGVGVAVGVTLNVIVFFVLAEAVPKTYAVLNPDRAAMIAARPVRALTAFPPLRMISAGLIGLTNVLVKGRGLESGPFVSEQEFLGIVEAAAQDEVIEHEERELIESIIEFGDTVAREVMVPRPDMVMVANTATITDALNLGIAHGFSRLPVSGSDEDDIVGLAFTKDLMRAEREGRGDLPVLDLARDVTFIPENKPVARLMREMQDSKFHIAIVADEYGDIPGSSLSKTASKSSSVKLSMSTTRKNMTSSASTTAHCWLTAVSTSVMSLMNLALTFRTKILTASAGSSSLRLSACLNLVMRLTLRVLRLLLSRWRGGAYVAFALLPLHKTVATTLQPRPHLTNRRL